MTAIRRAWGWINATRKHRIVTGTLATFLVAGAAFAYYTAVIGDGSGTATYGGALGPNSIANTTFSIVQNSGTSVVGLTPAADGCKGSSGAGTLLSPGSNCGAFNLLGDFSGTASKGVLDSLTLTKVDLPTGCPVDSVRVVWPDGKEATVNPDGTIGGEATYTEPTPVAFIANDPVHEELFPNSEYATAITPNSQPLLEFYDDGTSQDACANDGGGPTDGTGNVSLHFTGHATAT